MSYLLSGINIKNISEYDSSLSYSKYDVVDYQLTPGKSVYPSYGDLNDDLYFWFNNEKLSDFELDPDDNVTGWSNKTKNKRRKLYQDSTDENYKPYVDFSADHLKLNDKEFLTGEGFEASNRTLFICFKTYAFTENFLEQEILSFDKKDDITVNSDGTVTSSQDVGSLKLKGSFSPTVDNLKIILDDTELSAKHLIYDTQNIVTLVQSYDSNTQAKNLKVRHNGYEIGDLNTFNDGWLNGFLKIGDNPGFQEGVDYYDVFAFTQVLNETQIDYYEKYLFETYFKTEGLYFAKADVPAGDIYSPATVLGDFYYWTRDINDLFELSYGSSVSFSSKLSTTEFGDGYKNSVARNINPLEVKFDLVYDGLTDKEAKSLITFFENVPEAPLKDLHEGYSGVKFNLFSPYKKNAELYFLDLDHSSSYNNINSVKISAESLYDSSVDYKGMLVQLDEDKIRTYNDNLTNFQYDDVVYVESFLYKERGYYFYTGQGEAGVLDSTNGPLGADSHFTKDFYFKSDIDYNINSSLSLRSVDLEGSTKEYTKNGINYNLMEFDLVFTNRSNKEARAILKFLDSHLGYRVFKYTLPQPYNKEITVYCPEWNHTYKFLDNNDITVKFIEFKANSSFYDVGFNT